MSPVLITGESGTGKRLAAKAIYTLSDRFSKPFLAVNCSAITESLLESELFGHVKGSFTGAVRDKIGLFQAADQGVLFLDEIGDISLQLQLKLLRALQEREIRRVGDEKPFKLNVRLVAATHRNLKKLITTGEFREDFYYRIRVFEITMPPLRDRKEDIPLLINYFISAFSKPFNKKIIAVSKDALNRMMEYPWPGNVRENSKMLSNMPLSPFKIAKSL
jgi:two-component system response regulator HydG